MNTPPKFRFAVALAAACLPLGALAQLAAPASQDQTQPKDTKPVVLPKASSASTADDESVIILSPFEVSAAKDNGYAATETLAGTRIRTDLKDVGAAISVLTKQFMDDIGANDAGTLLQYTTNGEVAGVQGNFAGLGNGTSVDESGNLRQPASAQRIRGLAAADNARDYYVTDIPFDSYNTDRVDILRGPNSILFGLGSPAGIVNNSLRNAEFRDMGSLQFRVDNYGSVRTAVDYNKELLPGVLAVRIDALNDDQKYEQKQAFQNSRRLYGTFSYTPKLFKAIDGYTSIKGKFEAGQTNADRPRIIPPQDSITPWWRPNTISASNPFGGMGMQTVSNPYDVWRTDVSTAGTSYGLVQVSSPNFQPWLTDQANVQQPLWFINGSNNQMLGTYGGYINNGAVSSTGTFTGISSGIVNLRQNGMFYGLTGLSQVATTSGAYAYNLPGSQYGLYKNMSLQDSSVFDFYNNLIDGPSAREWEDWGSQNIDISQTAFGDRIGVDLTYDHQQYHNGADLLLGGSPTLTLDITRNFGDYYTKGGDGETTTTNPNFGRPYVVGANNNGGTSYNTDREVKRAALFAEFRASDLHWAPIFTKIFGKQRFNFAASDEKFFNETRTWQDYANSQAWDGLWNGNAGNSNAFTYRAPVAIIYLGNPVNNRASASGANIPGITSAVTLPSTGVYIMNTTWNGGTTYGNAWNPSANYSAAFNTGTTLYQASNPANYTGWSTYQDNLLEYNDGQNNALLKSAQKSLRETTSYSGSEQGYFWNNSIVTTLGWRLDEVKTKDVTAAAVTLNRAELNMDPGVYALPAIYPANEIDKGHSTSGGIVLHFTDMLPRNPLPFNISGSYNESSNFQVTSVRRDVFGTPIGNPSGKTYEYGVQLSTKDGKFSVRYVNYDTRLTGNSTGLSSSGTLGSVVAQGLRWRNVFLYQLGGYTMDTANQNSYRNTWTNAYPSETAAQAQAEEDAAITGWNNIQTHLQSLGFFSAWNFTPTSASALTTRTNYLANPSAYQPDPSTVSAYSASSPQGFAVTADTDSKGNEYEFTYNPLPNWRISLNAAETTAVRANVGGATLDSYVGYITSQLINTDGTLTPAGKLPQYGGASNAIYPAIWGPWLSNYQLLKLQQGAAVAELRKWHFNLIQNYTFTSGYLKNFGVGGAYRWQDKVVIGYPATNGVYDLSHPYWGPSEGYLDLWVSYHHKVTDKIDWKIQLNARNVGDQNGVIPISVEPDGHTWASVRTKPVQEFLLDNTFTF